MKSKGTIEISKDGKVTEEIKSKHTIISTGDREQFPELQLMEKVITSSEAMTLQSIPKSMIIIGAGAIESSLRISTMHSEQKLPLWKCSRIFFLLDDKEISNC